MRVLSAGYWGTDCSLSHAMDVTLSTSAGSATGAGTTTSKVDGPFIRLLADEEYVPRKRGPRIYVYELPGEFNMYGNLNRLDRPLYLLFWQRLLSAGVRTPNGDEVGMYTSIRGGQGRAPLGSCPATHVMVAQPM